MLLSSCLFSIFCLHDVREWGDDDGSRSRCFCYFCLENDETHSAPKAQKSTYYLYRGKLHMGAPAFSASKAKINVFREYFICCNICSNIFSNLTHCKTSDDVDSKQKVVEWHDPFLKDSMFSKACSNYLWLKHLISVLLKYRVHA